MRASISADSADMDSSVIVVFCYQMLHAKRDS
jgi:hypothetical protein